MKTNRMLFSSRASASTSRAHLEAATTKARVNFETARAAESMGDEALAFGSSNVKGECVTRDVHFLSSLRRSRGLFLLARRVSENSEAPISPLKFEQQDFAATAAGAKVVGSVSGKTDVLVAGEKAGGKAAVTPPPLTSALPDAIPLGVLHPQQVSSFLCTCLLVSVM